MKLYQLELNQSIVNCGMSYILQMNDQSYFVIDGGYFTPGEDDRLFSFLKSHTTSPWPLIKGWVFTHAHQDHIGCFMEFARKYLNDVIIENLYFNFQPIDLSKSNGNWQKKSNDIATVDEFYKMLNYIEDMPPINTVKTGDIIEFADVKIEVLYTPDDILPKECAFNDYSVVFSINIADQRLLFLGDAQTECSKFLLENKADKLKSTFVQVAHHGFEGATKELYKAIAPEIVLFPTPDFEFEKNKDNDVNSYILNDLDIKEYYVSGNGTTEFNLPYEYGTAKKFKKQYYFEPKKSILEKLKFRK